MKKTYFLLAAAFLVLSAFKATAPLLKYEHFKSIKVPEPSDIAFDGSGQVLYVVSDNGILYECTPEGKVLRRAAFEGLDFEGVEVVGDYIYVADESLRQVHRFDREYLKKDKTWYVPYSGGRNKGYESLAFNRTTERFVLITEKDPIVIKELNGDFIPVNEYAFTAARDISGARYHNGYMYLLSDEDRKVFMCHPETYEVIKSWKIEVLNPEGIAFDKDGRLVIAADDLERLYFFGSLPQ